MSFSINEVRKVPFSHLHLQVHETHIVRVEYAIEARAPRAGGVSVALFGRDLALSENAIVGTAEDMQPCPQGRGGRAGASLCGRHGEDRGSKHRHGGRSGVAATGQVIICYQLAGPARRCA